MGGRGTVVAIVLTIALEGGGGSIGKGWGDRSRLSFARSPFGGH